MKTYWLTGRDDDPSHQPGCPFVQLMEQERLQHARERRDSDAATANMCPHRPVYSPVSFDDLHADSTPRMSPVATTHFSPSKVLGSAGGVESRKGSKASGTVYGAGGDNSKLLPSSSIVTSSSAPYGGNSVGSAMVKPMQAVPPQLTADVASQKPSAGEVHGEVSQQQQPQQQHLNHLHKHKVSAGLQGLHQKQQTTSIAVTTTTTPTAPTTVPAPSTNCNSNAVLNNNDKAQPASSQAQERIYPIKDLDSGKGPVNGARKANVVIKPAAKSQPETISGSRKQDHPEKARSKTCLIV